MAEPIDKKLIEREPRGGFDAPIPGESLTSSPDNAKAWERPPQYADEDKAWYVNGESIFEDEFFKRTDWREDQHIVDLRYLRDVLSIDSIELETASELLKTNLLKIAISIIDEMHDDAMKEKRANGFLG